MLVCVRCNKPISQSRLNKGATYCSTGCQVQHNKVSSTYPSLPSATVGAISELKVCTDLLIKGYEVFRAVSSACSCDLAILKNGELKRVEVRTSYYLQTGKISCPDKNFKADIFAKVLPDKIIYEPTL